MYGPSALRVRAKTRALLTALVALLALALSGPLLAAEKPSRRPWHERDKLYDVAVMGDLAWVVGYPGIILHTRDRGATWVLQEGGRREALYSVQFLDERTGFIVGRRGLVLTTKDGGAHWEMQESGIREPLMDVSFVDPEYGWAVGNFGTIIHTVNGGVSWTLQSLGPGEDPVLNGVHFVDRERGWLTGEFGTIARTTDGGRIWEPQDTDTERSLFGFAFDRTNQRAVAVGGGGIVVSSEDAGESWSHRYSGTRDPLLHVAFGKENWVACGRGGRVVAPADDGFKIERADEDTYVWLAALDLNESGFGIMVGGSGVVFRTQDSGATWELLGAQESR